MTKGAGEACSGNLSADNALGSQALGSQALGATNPTFYRFHVPSILSSINLTFSKVQVLQI